MQKNMDIAEWNNKIGYILSFLSAVSRWIEIEPIIMHHAVKIWCIVSMSGRFAKSVTVVDTVSATVIFYFSPSEERFLRKAGLFPNISGHRRDVRPNLLRPWWENPGLSKTAIVIRVETINDYYPYRNPPKAVIPLWTFSGFSLTTVGQKGLKGQSKCG